MFFTDFSGLTVEQATELRREFLKAGVDYRVVKNTLIQKALEQVTGYDKVFDRLAGPTGVAFAFEDPVAPAKIIQKFKDKHNKLSLKICVLEQAGVRGSKARGACEAAVAQGTHGVDPGKRPGPACGRADRDQRPLRDIASIVDEIGKKKPAAEAAQN